MIKTLLTLAALVAFSGTVVMAGEAPAGPYLAKCEDCMMNKAGKISCNRCANNPMPTPFKASSCEGGQIDVDADGELVCK